ncbi:Ribosomal protein S6--L-glutamate ligase [Botrimarina colliarenosi]|uniref:Ribosomal protein S6--L-glutamate ligase n=1 Tax=Botrimarina colliarenosi TaxID=2528001 RepID=A0A5C6AJ73_9BACT|nr:alpha-L-glutamate ligase-like protein [Botrimarina colliarenosi]TWT99517.1 Ribosomal protein S6--L-glutamate ligase [Botrimarina colliarenosi]
MPRWFAWPSELKDSGILGINRRNLSYILESNPRRLYPRVDNKLITKSICEANDIPVPETYGVFDKHGEVGRFPELVREITDFVIKPACGAAGRGVMVIAEHVGDIYISPSGRGLRWNEVRYHLSTIISGLHSLGGKMDTVIVERRIVTHPALDSVSVGGTPDVRVILYRGIPVMAMLRLPTHASGGRANLHQGAIAAAIDLSSGQTYGGVCSNRIVDEHPDTHQPIAGIELPNWRHLLDSAMKLSDALEMGYIGVDFVIDAQKGPVVLEANARPGLAIQVANRVGIWPRLERVRSNPDHLLKGDARWRLIDEVANMGL